MSQEDSPPPVGDSMALLPLETRARTRIAVELSAESFISQGNLVEILILTSGERSAAATKFMSFLSEYRSDASNIVADKHQMR